MPLEFFPAAQTSATKAVPEPRATAVDLSDLNFRVAVDQLEPRCVLRQAIQSFVGDKCGL